MRTPCLLILPGEHVVTLLPKTQQFIEALDHYIVKDGRSYNAKEWTALPSPTRHTLRFQAEPGKEYILAFDFPDRWNWNYMRIWIEDKRSRQVVTRKVRFDWK